MVLITSLISGPKSPQGIKRWNRDYTLFLHFNRWLFFFLFWILLDVWRREESGGTSCMSLGPFYFHLHALYRQQKERRGLVDGTACHSPSKTRGFPATDKVVCRSQRRATLYDHRATLTSIMTIWILISCQLPVLSKDPCSREFPWNVARW